MVNTFSFEPETTFEVIDGGFEGKFDGTGDSVFPDNFFTVVLGNSGEAAEFAEFDISKLLVPKGETIISARFEVEITGLEVAGLGVPIGDNPDKIGVFGYVGNGVADVSDLEAGVLLDIEDTSNPSVGQQLSFDVTKLVKNLVKNGESFAGLGLRALEFGGLSVDPASISMPKLIIETGSFDSNLPVAIEDSITTFQNSAIAIPVTSLLVNDISSDDDFLTITAVNNAIDGNVILDDKGTPDNSSDDKIIFTPDSNFNGEARFEYTISDTQGNNDTTLVTVRVPKNIDGTQGNDNLLGSDEYDIIDGFNGNDTLKGFGGKDILKGGEGEDELFGGDGDDNLLAGDGEDIVNGDEGNDFLNGGCEKDELNGGIGNDGLLGGKHEDILNGDEGDDFLNGGEGADTLTGGTGADTFYIDGNSSTTDIFTDFNLEEGDKITTFNNLVFSDLFFVGNDILFGDKILATLEGFDTTSLNSTNFNVI